MKIYKRLKSPLCVQIEITSACNCRCSHCYNAWRPFNKKPQHMTKKVADRILQVMQDNEIKKACLTGGEPFLNFEIFKYLTEKMQAAGIKVSTNTNLSVATEEQLNYALDHKLRIFTTIMGYDPKMHDGMTNCKGSFEKSITNIKRCIASGNEVLVNIVVTKAIINDVYKIASFLAEFGVKYVFASLVICPEYAKGTDKEPFFLFNEDDIANVLNSLLDVRDKYGIYVSTITTFPLCSLSKVRDVTPFMNRRCVAGRSELGINFEGKVARCPQSGDYVGDLLEEDFKTIWDRIEECVTSSSFPDICVKCPLFKLCSGGCRVSAKSSTGCWNGLDPKTHPENVSIVLKNIQEHMHTLMRAQTTGYCRKEDFGSVYIRSDDNYALLDKYFTNEELKDIFYQEKHDIINDHIIPIVLEEKNCMISPKGCTECSLHDICYTIHNCR